MPLGTIVMGAADVLPKVLSYGAETVGFIWCCILIYDRFRHGPSDDKDPPERHRDHHS